MIATQYFCDGCSKIITEEEFDNGIRDCCNEECGSFGKPLLKRKYCSECQTYFFPALSHTHGANMMPRFKLPVNEEKSRISMDELVAIQQEGGEING